MVVEFLLGDNPFIGVSHLSQEKAREERKEASLENRARVIEAAIEGGATGFTFSTHEANLELLNYLRESKPSVLERLNYYILVPYAAGYVRMANITGTPGLVKRILSTVVRRRGLGSTVELLRVAAKPERAAVLFLESELEPYLRVLPSNRVKAILLHEIATELIVAFRLCEFLKVLGDGVRKVLGVPLGLETRNAGQTMAMLEECGWYPEYLMTPMNPLGYQMAPSKEEAEEAIARLAGKTRVIAVNTLASGAVGLEESIAYLRRFKDVVYAVTSASTKPHRIKRNFELLRENLA